MSDSSRHIVYLVAEATYGTTPATPALTQVRLNSTSLAVSKDGFLSEELRGDGQITDHAYGVRQVGGDIVSELTYGGATDILFEAALMGTWDVNVLKAGTMRRSFSILRHYSDLAALANPWHIFTGVEVNTLNFQNAANNRTQVTFGLLGRNLAMAGTSPTGATFPAVTTSKMMTSITGQVNEGGSPLAIVTDINFTLENGLEIRPVVGSDLTLRPSRSQSNASGTLTAYFESSDMLQKFLSGTESSIGAGVIDPAGNSYDFEFPRIKYTGGQADTSGQGSITIPLPFQALRDSTDQTNITITRA